METITSTTQLQRLNTDVRVRMRHHAPAVQRVGDILYCCIMANPTLQVEGIVRKHRYGYCYKITTPSRRRMYITYEHNNERIIVKNKMRNYRVLHSFDNNAPVPQLVSEVRNILS